MKDFETIIKKESEFSKTLNVKQILSKRVLAATGLVVGRVSQIRFNPLTKNIEGIITKNFWHKPLYIGLSYINQITVESVILNMEPSVFLRGRKIIDYEGKVLGKVSKINRKGNKNDVESIILSSFMKRSEVIPFSAISKLGKSIILKKDYDVKQKYFWQRSK